MTLAVHAPSDPDVVRLQIAMLVVTMTGCSALTVRGPRSTPTGKVCDATYVAPAIDTAFAITGTALAVWGVTGHEDPEGHTVTARNFAAAPGLLMAMVFGLSALYGVATVGSCHRAAD